MSTDTPRPERVILTDEERDALWLVEHAPIEATYTAVERILAAREQALRDEIAANIRTTLTDPERVRPRRKDAEFATDLADDVEWAAMIAEGENR